MNKNKSSDIQERKKVFKTDSGIEIKRIYEPIPIKNEEPGEFPFTRGVHPTMYRGKLWTMRQYAGFSSAEESNQRYRYLLSQGTTGLSIAFDLPTQIGYDSDHPLADGEVGKVGVAIDSLQDMEILFKEIPLEKVSTSMTINSTATSLLAFYVALAKKQSVGLDRISGTVQNDILKEYAARGTYIFPPKPSMKLVTDIFEYCKDNIPKWNSISISGYHIREAGSTAVQELAFTLSNGKTYIKAALDKGIDINILGQRISFFFNAHNNFFEEIAKYRVARRMWAKIMKELGVTNPQAMMLRFHTQTGGSTLTAQQPENNIVRVTLQALASVIGGTQSLHTNSYDEALSLPSEKAAKIALRTQQIIAYESGVTETVDPFAGSYFMENLTNELESATWKEIEIIDKMGGSVKAIESGYIQNKIAGSSYKYQRDIEEKEKIIVGVNQFIENEERKENIFSVNESVQQNQLDKIKKLKSARDTKKVENCLNELEISAKENKNVLPYIIEAAEEYSTLGEINDVFRKVWGEYK